MSLLKTKVYLVFIALFILSIGAVTSVTLLSVSAALMVIPSMYFFIHDKHRWQTPSKSQWVLLSMFFWFLLSPIFILDTIDEFFQIFWKLKYIILAFFSVYAFKFSVRQFSGKKWIWWVINGFLLSVIVATLAGLIGLWFGITPLRFQPPCHAIRSCGLYASYHSYAYIMSLCALLLVGMSRDWERLRHVCSIGFLFFATLVAIVGLVFSLTKGAWIAFFAGLSFFYFKENHKKSLQVFGLLIALLGLSVALIPKVQQAFTQRTITNEQRVSLLESAWYGFRESPIVGFGFGRFSDQISWIKSKYDLNYPLVSGQVPNDYLEILASTGVIGLLLYLAFLFLWLREMFVREDLMARICFPLIIGVMTAGVFHFTMGDRAYFPFLMVLYALSQIVVPKVKL